MRGLATHLTLLCLVVRTPAASADATKTPAPAIFKPEKKYSGVVMQQGRVQTDADWNESSATAAFARTIFDEMEPVARTAPGAQISWAHARPGGLGNAAALRSDVQASFPKDPEGMRAQTALLASLLRSGELLAAAKRIAEKQKPKTPGVTPTLAARIETLHQTRSRILRDFATSKPPHVYAGNNPQSAARAQDSSARYTQFVQMSTQLMSELQNTERELMDALQGAERDLESFWQAYSSMRDESFRTNERVIKVR